MHINQDAISFFFTFYVFCSFEITWHILLLYNKRALYLASCVQHFLYVTLFYGPEQDLCYCRGCLPLLIAVYRLLDFDQMWLESKDNRNYKEKKRNLQKRTFSYMGAELEKGRNLWGSNPKRAETSGNQQNAYELLFYGLVSMNLVT